MLPAGGVGKCRKMSDPEKMLLGPGCPKMSRFVTPRKDVIWSWPTGPAVVERPIFVLRFSRPEIPPGGRMRTPSLLAGLALAILTVPPARAEEPDVHSAAKAAVAAG